MLAINQTKPSTLYLLSLIVCGVYFFTGVTALSYEVLWARMLSTIFGVSIFGVVITISAFMAGLGAGSFLGARVQSRITNPLLVFGLIEFFVALFAFNLPGIFSGVDELVQSATIGSTYTFWLSTQIVVTFFLMFLPAFGLGFGFPLILKTVLNNGVSLGFVYSLNTLGGMLGALLPLFLLPIFGWIVSDRLVAVAGFVIAIIIIILSFFLRPPAADSGIDEFKAKVVKSFVSWKVLGLYAVIGASAIMLEIAWTRLYGMILLRTEYVMAIILATFLLGIGLGSLLATRVTNIRWLFILPCVISLSALSSLYFLPQISAWAEVVEFSSLGGSMLEQGGVIALFSLPATLAFGAWLPILVASHGSANQTGAYLYGANSIGGAVGGLFAGFILIPYLGTNVVIAVSTILVLLVSLQWVKERWFKVFSLIVFVLFIPMMSFSSVSLLLPNSHKNSVDLQVYEDALTVTHVIEDENGQRLLLADLQRMDASTAPDAITVQKNQSRLPLMLHPEPKSILFLGLGTGITASGSLPYLELERTAVELSKGAIDAASTWFKESNGSIVNDLLIVKDDARRYLKSTDKKFDVIIGDLFHPDLIGRSNLLSIQQFDRARLRLSENGVFVQWIALNQFDVETLKVVLATFKKSFSVSHVFVDGFRVALVGYKDKFNGGSTFKSSTSLLDLSGLKEITGGEGIWTWMGRYWGPLPESQWLIQDEWAPVIEFQLPKAKFNRQMDLVELLKFMFSFRSDVALAKESLDLSGNDTQYFEDTFQATSLYYQSWIAYFSGQNLESQKLLSLAYMTNSDDQWIGFGMADAMFASIKQVIDSGVSEKEALDKILLIRPDHIGALKRKMEIANQEGDLAFAASIKKKLLVLSPLERM